MTLKLQHDTHDDVLPEVSPFRNNVAGVSHIPVDSGEKSFCSVLAGVSCANQRPWWFVNPQKSAAIRFRLRNKSSKPHYSAKSPGLSGKNPTPSSLRSPASVIGRRATISLGEFRRLRSSSPPSSSRSPSDRDHHSRRSGCHVSGRRGDRQNAIAEATITPNTKPLKNSHISP